MGRDWEAETKLAQLKLGRAAGWWMGEVEREILAFRGDSEGSSWPVEELEDKDGLESGSRLTRDDLA